MIKLHTTLENTFPTSYNKESKYISKALNGYITHDDATLSFKMQEGPIKEVGENGIQVNEVLQTMIGYLKVLDKEKTCEYNDKTIRFIAMAIEAQEARSRDRIDRGVEGTSNE